MCRNAVERAGGRNHLDNDAGKSIPPLPRRSPGDASFCISTANRRGSRRLASILVVVASRPLERVTNWGVWEGGRIIEDRIHGELEVLNNPSLVAGVDLHREPPQSGGHASIPREVAQLVRRR